MMEPGHIRGILTTLRHLLNRRVSTLSQMTAQDITTRHSSEVRSFDEIPGPTGPYKWPIIGTILNFYPFTQYTPENTFQLLRSLYLKHGPVFRLQLGRDTVIVTEPEDVEKVFRNEGRCPARPNLGLREIYSKRTGVTLRDVSTLQGEEWHALRSPLNKLLVKVNAATHYLPQQSKVADDFVSSLANQNLTAQKISELFFRFSAESIGVVCFNSRLGLLRDVDDGNLEIQTFLQAAKDNFTMLHRSLTGKSFAHAFYRNETYREYENSMLILNKYSRKLLSQARHDLKVQTRGGTLSSDTPNMLHSLLSDNTLDDESVSQILESLFIGGTDSTAGSLSALFYNLARNPEKQEKLASEVIKYSGSSGEVTPESLSQMHYLKACVKESFRLHYPVSAVIRVLPKDIVVSGYQVPAGVQIFLVNALTCEHRFERSQEYLPERWLRSADGRLGDLIPKNAVLPFGIGPRNCIGRRFAEQEIFLATIKVLQRLRILLDAESRDAAFVYRIFLQPERPIKFLFTERQCAG